ncbi:hypothetical protein D3C80_1500150 [compost metagenome]
MAWIGDRGRHALAGVHADLHRGGGDLPPGHAAQAAGQRVGAAVDVADIPDQPAVLDVVAVDAQAEDGARQRPAAGIDGEQLVAVQQFAARHAIGVEDEQLEQVDIGVLRQELLGILHGGEWHGALVSAKGARPASGDRTQSSEGLHAGAADSFRLERKDHPVGGHDGNAITPRTRGFQAAAG